MDQSKTIPLVKEARLQVDALCNSFQFLKPSREVSLAFTSLQLVKSWLGKVLGTLNSPDPYPASRDAKSNAIEPQAEHEGKTIEHLFEPTEGKDAHEIQISRVKTFRAEIKRLEDAYLPQFAESYENNPSTMFNLFGTEAFKEAVKAQMWLGWELDRIRKSQLVQEELKDYTQK